MKQSILFTFALVFVIVLPGCSALLGPSTQPSPIVITATPLPSSPTSEAALPTAESTAEVIPTTTPLSEPATLPPPVIVPAPTEALQETPVMISTPAVGLPTPHGDGQCSYFATFLGDVTVPDNTVIAPGSTFVKTWRVRNDGSCTWGSGGFAAHSLVQTGGNLTGPKATEELPDQVVNRGDVIDVSVILIAPTRPGTYRSEWMFHVDNGPAFGAGPNGQSPLFAQIVVATAPTPPPTPQGTCSYAASFLGDVTIPDNTVIQPGATFVKTWRVRNDGICSWGTAGYALHSIVAVGGDSLGQSMTVPLPAGEVDQGQTVDISVPMQAPTAPGTYRSLWKLQVENGPQIGVGPYGMSPLYAQIVVPNTGATSQRIVFAPGATQAAVDDSIGAGQTKDYYISAQAGQIMILTLSAPVTGNPKMTVLGWGEFNPQVLNAVPGGWYWRGLLPVTGDYIIRVRSTGAATNFTMSVVIPQRISFAPGSYSGTVTGTTSGRQTVTYLLNAGFQQQATVTLAASTPNAAALTIYGLVDGQPLVRAQSGQTTWSGQLPATQDYVIEVVPSTDAPFSFTLTALVR